MRLRPAERRDLAQIAAVHAASWREAYREMLPQDYLDHRVADDLCRHWAGVEIGAQDVVLVAEDDGETIGFIAVWCRPDPLIDNLHVLPGRRSGGVGRALMAAAADCLLRQGRRSAHLWVLEQNHRATAFYAALGGVAGTRQDKSHFGHRLQSRRIDWPDLSEITRRYAS